MSESAPPTTLGPYRVLSRLGEGGMGTVFLAEQQEPVKRRVALKVIKLGMDSKAVVARFEQERQALALMQHDGIAKVFDCGTSDRGQPYFVMEYVKGVPLSTYCDQNRLTLEGRIELIQQVCAAVQHAHQKGVVHRDLKPGNVLVTEDNGVRQIKIIDFGLAKAMGQKLVEATLFTEAGQIVGTPEYMAPEQADPTNQDIDTRADVYSIGVMAYEVLTGQLPFTTQQLRGGGMMEAQRVLREVDPPKPSTRLSQLGESASAIATARRMTPSALRRTLKSDLDWVVLKALEKDRARRYESADALSMDLQRFLDHEPVMAGPPSTWYRAQKLVRRYRTQFVSLALVLGALGAGLVLAVTAWDEAEAQRKQADEARETAVEEREKAENNLKNFQRLRDDVKLQQFVKRAKAFTETSRDVEGMATWEREVESWLAGMDDHEQSLAALRARGSKETDGTYRFADPGDQFLHDALARLIDGWKAFRSDSGEQKRVATMRQWAEQVRKKTVDEQRDRWAKAKAEIAANPKYAGLQLAPQEGLVPLGVDPDSGDNKLQAFAHLRSAGKGYALGLPEEVDENTPVLFVLIPGGAATIGNPRGDSMPIESPAQTVGLAPYFLAKHELTQAQWSRLSDLPNPSRYSEARGFGGANRHPVESISWLEASELARRHDLVLPTEAQWEHGCRAGKPTRWWMGDEKDDIAPLRADGYREGRFNAADGFRKRKSNVEDAEFFPELDDGFPVHVWVDHYDPNPFGLYHVHGNVAELTRDAFASYQDIEKKGLTFAPADGELLGGNRAWAGHRGGSWFKRVEAARSFARKEVAIDTRSNQVGVRLARAIQP